MTATPTSGRAGAHGALAIGVGVVLALLTCTPARATQTAGLSAAFSPERLGAPTAVTFAFTIKSHGGAVPPPLSAVQIRYPAGLGLATNGLGVAACQPARLEQSGPGACPADSRMGGGEAQLRFAVGPEILEETASLALIAGPSTDGYVHMLIAATGTQPVAARVVMSTVLDEGALPRSACRPCRACPKARTSRSSACTPRSAGSSPTTNAAAGDRRLPPAGDRAARPLPSRRIRIQRGLHVRRRQPCKRAHDRALPRAGLSARSALPARQARITASVATISGESSRRSEAVTTRAYGSRAVGAER